jgi:precorrin-2 dehydrogenase/sirohydrochlorin ferrochelatase
MYPLFLKLDRTPCLIVGGGSIAWRKTLSLLEAGANVTLISPDVTEELDHLIQEGKINYKKRFFESGDTSGFFLIIAATNSRDVNTVIYREAEINHALINCVDDPESCNFYVPAQLKRGSLKIAISTGGKLPMLAGMIRRYLEPLFPEKMGSRLDELGSLRNEILGQADGDEEKKKEMFEKQLIPLMEKLLEEVKK